MRKCSIRDYYVSMKGVKILKEKIQKVEGKEEIQEEILQMISNITAYVNKADEHRVTTQGELGMRYLFRGWVTKDQRNINEA